MPLSVCGHPEHSVHFAHQHDVGVWQCFCSLLVQPFPTAVWEVGGLSLHLGGLGLRSVSRTIHAAVGAVGQIRQRHVNIAQTMVQALDSPPEIVIHLVGAARSRVALASEGFESPSWHQLLQGLRPHQLAFDEMEPGFFSHGWQFLAAKVVEQRFRSTVVWPRCTPSNSASTPPFSIGSHVRASFFSTVPSLLLVSPLNFSGCFSFAGSGFLFLLPVWPSLRRP